MAGMILVGKQEEVRCIVDVDAKGSEGEALCLAYKTTTYFAGGGVWMTDDGYVLRPRAEGATAYYHLPEGEVAGLPHPLPPYAPTLGQYLWGFSLWVLVAASALAVRARRVHGRVRQAKLRDRLANAPVDEGPPRLATKGDRAVAELVRPLLEPAESVQHQAYALSWNFAEETAGDDAFFVYLTTKRVLFVRTRLRGFGGIAYENDGFEGVARAEIRAAHVEGGNVVFLSRADGVQRGHIVKATNALSNQDAFVLNVARLLDAREQISLSDARAEARPPA